MKRLLFGLVLCLLLSACAPQAVPEAVPETQVSQPQEPESVMPPEADASGQVDLVKPVETSDRPFDDLAWIRSVLDPWLSDREDLRTLLQDAVLTARQDESGLVTVTFRSAEGGILPTAVAALVLDPETDAVTPRFYAGRVQQAYAPVEARADFCRLWSGDSTWTVPKAQTLYLRTSPSDWAESWSGEGLFHCQFSSENGGNVAGLYRVDRTAMETGPYPDWQDLCSAPYGARGMEIGRDSQYVYFFWEPTDLQFDPDVSWEAALYDQEAAVCCWLTDRFLLENGLTANPHWFGELDSTRSRARLRVLMNQIQVSEAEVLLTIPAFYMEAEMEPWNLTIRGQRVLEDGNVEQVELSGPQGGWQDGETYAFSLEGLQNVTLTAAFSDEMPITLRLQPATTDLNENARILEPATDFGAAVPENPEARAAFAAQADQWGVSQWVRAETPLEIDGLGRIVLPLRTEDGTIPATVVEALVYDPDTGRVTPRYYAWRLQNGPLYDHGPFETVSDGTYRLHVPEGFHADAAGSLFACIQAEKTPSEGQTAVAWDGQWTYCLWEPSEDTESPAAAAQRVFSADLFAWENGLTVDPDWPWPRENCGSEAMALLALLNHVRLEAERAYVTIPEGDFPWEITIEAEQCNGGDTAFSRFRPADGRWEPGQTYVLELDGIQRAVLTASLPGQEVYTVGLQRCDTSQLNMTQAEKRTARLRTAFTMEEWTEAELNDLATGLTGLDDWMTNTVWILEKGPDRVSLLYVNQAGQLEVRETDGPAWILPRGGTAWLEDPSQIEPWLGSTVAEAQWERLGPEALEAFAACLQTAPDSLRDSPVWRVEMQKDMVYLILIHERNGSFLSDILTWQPGGEAIFAASNVLSRNWYSEYD